MKYSTNDSGVSPCVGDVRPRSSALEMSSETTIGCGYGRECGRGRALVAGLLAAVLVAAPSLSMAEDSAAEVGKESGLGAAAALSSLLYGPAKILYATGGVIIGGFAYAFTAGDTEVASKVFTRSLRGDYVITPAILTGDDTLEFIGRDIPAQTETPATAVAAAGPVYEDTEYDELGW
jgi:hypothetical protein